MEIKLHELTVRDIANGYVDNNEDGVVAYGGKLDVRPAYQREFVYKDKQRDAVIESIRKNYPLNVMYWVDNGNNQYEVLDGQQRTISICQYVNGYYSINDMQFDCLESDEQKQILDYKLQIYVCSNGTDSEKLAWFHTINIAGEKLSDQELRNATYRGPWLNEAKKHFSKTNNPAQSIADKYINAKWNRQEGLETVLSWISNGKIESYMNEHKNDSNDNELWLYFQNVINWVKLLFPNYRKEMKSVNWGALYNSYHTNNYDANELESVVAKLMADSEVQDKKGIYEYVFDSNQKHLNLRQFDDNTKRTVYERQGGICPMCKNTPNENKKWNMDEMEADHHIPWSRGGQTTIDNCVMLCREHNRIKSNK
ncbi:MAG: DUF262 domain-containing protein [Alphaproteobacteria bacterium]|nr:DUF262 domain-containing protein [Alphaproteobacteria bacterium]